MPRSKRCCATPPPAARWQADTAATAHEHGDERWLAGASDGGKGAPLAGSPYAELTLVDAGACLTVTPAQTGSGSASRRHFTVAALPQRLARLTREAGRITLHPEHYGLAVAPWNKPVWAIAIGRDWCCQYAEVCWRAERCGLDWQWPADGTKAAEPASSRSGSIASDCTRRSPSTALASASVGSRRGVSRWARRRTRRSGGMTKSRTR